MLRYAYSLQRLRILAGDQRLLAGMAGAAVCLRGDFRDRRASPTKKGMNNNAKEKHAHG